MNRPILKTWQKIVLIFFILIAVILFAAPRAAKWYISKKSPELIGREVSIDKIRLNYFSGVLRIGGLTVFEADNKTPFLSFKELLVNLDYIPFSHRELKLSKIRLDKLFCHVDQKGKEFNFSDMLPPKDSTAKEKPKKENPLILTFEDIHINDSRLEYCDLLLDNCIELDEFDFRIPGFTLNSGSTELDLKFDIDKGGGLSTDLVYDQNDSTYVLKLKLDSLNLDVAEPYLKSAMRFNDINGFFSNDILIQGDLHHLLNFQVRGWNRFDHFELIDPDNKKTFSIEKLFVDIDTFLFDTKDIQLKNVDIDGLYAMVERNDTLLNVASMFKHKRTVEERKEKKKERKEERGSNPAFLLKIDTFNFENGKIEFIDKSLDEPYTATIHDLTIKSKDLKGKSSPVAVNLTALLNESGEIESFFSLKSMQPKDITIDFALNKFAMNDIEPYLFHYFGYPVESGMLNFSTSNHFSTNHLVSNNKIYSRNFKMGEADKSDAEKKLPLKLAVGILTDKDGVIEIELPIESEGEETSIKNLGKLIGQALGNLLGKVAASPGAALAGSISEHPDKLEEVKFEFMKNVPDKDNMETLDLIIKVLDEKPALSVQLDYLIDSNFYQDTLARIFAEDTYKESKKVNAQPTDEELLEFVSEKLKIEDPSMGDLNKLCRDYAGSDYLTQKINNSRNRQIENITDYLNSNSHVSEDRYKITRGESDSIPKGSPSAHYLIKFYVEDN